MRFLFILPSEEVWLCLQVLRIAVSQGMTVCYRGSPFPTQENEDGRFHLFFLYGVRGAPVALSLSPPISEYLERKIIRVV
ncbi:hypothetical protein KFK09_014103 [Dendrobium nobile]|uniref:Uncharacterized protein n=1 Tax=Dendrobium nobile TaxID=94219 RepID=A0A8T3B910_DENNO|nr:hypothetical protein KFK09_014103 [Dendrobium nobile]